MRIWVDYYDWFDYSNYFNLSNPSSAFQGQYKKIKMKLFALLIILWSSTNTFSQDIPKNANVIVVKGVTFEKVVNSLLDSGFVIEKIDKEYQTLKTEYKKLCKDCIPEIQFYVRVKDSVLTITGKWRSDLNIFGGFDTNKSKDEALIFEIKNEKNKVPRESFKAMNKFAISLKGEIQYLVEK